MDSPTRVVLAVWVFNTVVNIPVAYGSPSNGFEPCAIGGDEFSVERRVQGWQRLINQFHDFDNVFADQLNDEGDNPGFFDCNQSLYAFLSQISVVMACTQTQRDDSLNPRPIGAAPYSAFPVVNTGGDDNCLPPNPNLETGCWWMQLAIRKLRQNGPDFVRKCCRKSSHFDVFAYAPLKFAGIHYHHRIKLERDLVRLLPLQSAPSTQEPPQRLQTFIRRLGHHLMPRCHPHHAALTRLAYQ